MDNTDRDDAHASINICVPRDETDEEYSLRKEREQKAAQKKAEFEALEYQRLKAKYGST